MQQQNITVGTSPTVVVESITGDLRAAGWDRSEIMAKTDGDHLNLSAEGERITVSCDENLILYLPRQASLSLDHVSGDATLQALSGPLVLGSVAGDLSMNDLGQAKLETVSGDASFRNIGSLTAKKISGDLNLRGARGDCSIESINGDASVHQVDGSVTLNSVGSDLYLSKVHGAVESSGSIGGDASLRDVDGAVTLKTIGSDLYLRNVRGIVAASAGADVALYLEPRAGLEYHVDAGDDLLVRLPPDADVELHLVAPSPKDVHVDFPGATLKDEKGTLSVTLGSGAARMFLTSGGDLAVTSQAEKWDSAADFAFGMKDGFEWPDIPGIPPLPPIPADLSDRINRRTQEAMERARSKIEAASRRTEARVNAAMRHAEAKARAAEARAHSWQGRIIVNGRPVTGVDGQVSPASDPVSDQERLTILKMLQEKKISLEEAEKLLAALEGK